MSPDPTPTYTWKAKFSLNYSFKWGTKNSTKGFSIIRALFHESWVKHHVVAGWFEMRHVLPFRKYALLPTHSSGSEGIWLACCECDRQKVHPIIMIFFFEGAWPFSNFFLWVLSSMSWDIKPEDLWNIPIWCVEFLMPQPIPTEKYSQIHS